MSEPNGNQGDDSSARLFDLSWRRQLLFALLLFLAFLACLEAAARLLFDPPAASRTAFDLAMSEPHPARVWHYRANARLAHRSPEFDVEVVTNSLRLRDGEPSGGGDLLRVLALGDSFTFGWGVAEADRFTERLLPLLGSPAGRSLEILNAGHWNYTYDQQLLLLEDLLPRYRPHVVLHGLYPSHVLTVGLHKWSFDREGRINSIGYAERAAVIRVDSSGALRMTNDWIEQPPLHSRFVAKLLQRVFRWKLTRTEAMKGDWVYLADHPGAARGYGMAERSISDTARASRNAGSRHVMFAMPNRLQLDRSTWPEHMRRGDPARYDLEYPNRRFAEIARAAGSDWIDVLPDFRARYERDLCFRRDPHWTAKGHQLAAEALAPDVNEILASLAASGGMKATPTSPAAASR